MYVWCEGVSNRKLCQLSQKAQQQERAELHGLTVSEQEFRIFLLFWITGLHFWEGVEELLEPNREILRAEVLHCLIISESIWVVPTVAPVTSVFLRVFLRWHHKAVENKKQNAAATLKHQVHCCQMAFSLWKRRLVQKVEADQRFGCHIQQMTADALWRWHSYCQSELPHPAAALLSVWEHCGNGWDGEMPASGCNSALLIWNCTLVQGPGSALLFCCSAVLYARGDAPWEADWRRSRSHLPALPKEWLSSAF